MLLRKMLRYSRRKYMRSQLNRCISSSSKLRSAYDGDGKTSVDILDYQRHPDLGLILSSYSQVGFRLSNGIYCVGPIVLFSRSVLSWDVGGPFDITPESLSLFTRLEPKLDILVLGIGDSLDWRRMIEKQIFRDVIKKSGMNVVIETTDHACSTYNFLCMEHRLVAGAFLPPLHIKVTDEDVIASKVRYDTIYDFPEDKPLFDEYLDKEKLKLQSKFVEGEIEKINQGFHDDKKRKAELGAEDTDHEYYATKPPPKSHYEKIAEKEEEERKRLEAKDKEFKYVGKGGKDEKIKQIDEQEEKEHRKLGEGKKDPKDGK